MYWLLEPELQSLIRERVIKLQSVLLDPQPREQNEQVFPFIGRKSRVLAKEIIKSLIPDGTVVCDPFGGSGTFAFSSLDCGKHVLFNEWEPYAFRMSTVPFGEVPSKEDIKAALSQFISLGTDAFKKIYGTRCPNCGREFMFDGLFFDRDPLEYRNPKKHERLGPNGENVIFRNSYKCPCGCSEKHFDDYDEKVLENVSKMQCDFPLYDILENSRLNFTSPQFTRYSNLFSQRQKVALCTLRDCIKALPLNVQPFFESVFLSIVHLGKYIDYRSKSQDNHCPSDRNKENNLFHRYIEKVEEWIDYLENHNFDKKLISYSCRDFRDFMDDIDDGSVDMVLTDPPYGDNAQYFEHAQRVHPFMNYSLRDDAERLTKEVVISDSPVRGAKHEKKQFLEDIEILFKNSYRILKEHGFFVLYFRPQQADWISDLNLLKNMGRRNGLEPLITVPIDNRDPSMRALASAAWTFKKDVCFVFLKLKESERRWFEGSVDVDELVYLAAKSASGDSGNPFIFETFSAELIKQLRRTGLIRLSAPSFRSRFEDTLLRYVVKNGAQYRLTGLSPYAWMNRDMDAEVRLREFAPIVIEELTQDGNGFTFEDFIIRLATYIENGSREIIQRLHAANRLIPGLLNQYAIEDEAAGKFFLRSSAQADSSDSGRISIREMDPGDFESLIGEFFRRRGYSNVQVIGRTCDRGVDVLSINPAGELELIQCKRWRKGNNVGSDPIQRIDSYMRTRHAVKAWVITTADFTKEGKDEARITGVKTMNGKELLSSLEVYFPGKYRI